MSRQRKRLARKANLITFGLLALNYVATYATGTGGAQQIPAVSNVHDNTQVMDPYTEATRAYQQALKTLSALTALPSPQADEPYGTSSHTSSFISSFLPSVQGQGPLASAMRIAIKLRHHSWVPHFVSTFFGRELAGGKRREEELRSKAVKVIDLLQHAAELGNTDALYTLAQISLFPPNTYFPSDPSLGYDAFTAHASLTGNASSQATLAFFHSTGYHGIVPVDQAKAQLYLTFAAHGNHKGAQMALGYRSWTGIGTAEDCMQALDWYEDAAEQTMAKFLAGPPGGRTLPLTATRLSDLVGGVYGPGASVASTGLNAGRAVIKTANARAAGETWEDLLEYYLFNADRGEMDFAYRLGKIFYQGSIYASIGGIASGGDGASVVPRDFHRARYYFLRIARQAWPRDPDPRRPLKEEAPQQAGYAPLAAGYLGRMYLRGEGLKQDFAAAKLWFDRGAEYGEKECHNGLGIILRDGLVDGKTDMKRALAHFSAAANQELAEAHVHLGKYHYGRGELKAAMSHFETAVRQGSPFEAYYYLAQIQASQVRSGVTPREIAGSSCAIAVSFYKLIGERGVWEGDLLKEADIAWASNTEREREMAMLRWWIAAERGFEVAQNNLAYVLDQDKSILRFTRFAPLSPSNDTARLALTQWTRSAAQRNIDALVKVGDYYYHGLGVPDEPEVIRWEKAAGYYQSAADTQMSALAMWNLGWMYENGIGVPQDFHLAKRHYDLALEANGEAYLPVALSLVKLYLRSIWHTLSGGEGGLSMWETEDETSSYYANPEGREIEGSQDRVVSEESHHGDTSDDGLGDDQWYLGKARDDFNKRKRGHDNGRTVHGEEDPVEWARARRQAEDNDRDGDFGPEDYFDGATRGINRGEEEADEFAETMLLVLLCLVVSLLLYIRGRWVERIRRDEQQQQPQQGQAGQNAPAGGLFPPPGDAARNDWAILR